MEPRDFWRVRDAYRSVWQQVNEVSQLLARDDDGWLLLGEALPQTLALPVVEWDELDAVQREEMTTLLQAVQEQIALFNTEKANWHTRRQHQRSSMQMQRKILHRYES